MVAGRPGLPGWIAAWLRVNDDQFAQALEIVGKNRQLIGKSRKHVK